MEDKIGEIVTLPPAYIEGRVVEDNSCDGCYYEISAWSTRTSEYSGSALGGEGKTART